MDKQRNFKTLAQDTNKLSTTGKQDDIGQTLPIGKSLNDIGLESANAQGEATIKKPKITKPTTRKSPVVKATTLKDYPTNRKIEIYPKVFVILDIMSKIINSDLDCFDDFINVSESTVDIIDVIPNLYPEHYNVIKHSSTRFMIDDKVIVNFRFKSIVNTKALLQSQPRIIKDIKFVALNDRTAVIAYLEDGDFYPINELDHYVEN